MSLNGSPTLTTGDQLSFRLSARISCTVSGHVSGTARLWFNDAQANSKLAIKIGGTAKTLYLRSGSALSETQGAGPRQTADVLLNSAVSCASRPFTTVGTFSITL
jgi:hypothetical protein